ncbi:MAG: alpha/beta hydrolase domain-containing protein, partial [Pseudohongiellaceae bacterium]
VKIFKLMAETDMSRRAAEPQPDSRYFRQWEVAGSSHVDMVFELEYAMERALAAGEPTDMATERNPGCDRPAYSRVPFRDVMNAAFEHMQLWIEDGTPPPKSAPLAVARMMPVLEFERDSYGNILGGIRLAEHAVPVATNTGVNSGANSRFCFLYGSHEPFDQTNLRQLYPDHASYVNAVRAVVRQNLADGYILPEAAARTIQEAEQSSIGRW